MADSEGAGDAKAIISPSCTPAGDAAAIKEGGRGRSNRRSLTVTGFHSKQQVSGHTNFSEIQNIVFSMYKVGT